MATSKTNTSSTQRNSDLPDSKKDQEKLKPEIVTIDMPEVHDIPGQENIEVPNIREMQDVTISSEDEEAEELLSELNTREEGNDRDNNDNVSVEEERLLRRSAGHPETPESKDYKAMSLDTRDDDNEALNEKASNNDRFGEDLDVPGAELDNEDEDNGEEDEENNQYSRPD